MSMYKNINNSINVDESFVINAGGAPSIEEALFTKRPAPGIAGRLFLDTYQGRWYRDNGTQWVSLQTGPAGRQGPQGVPGVRGPRGLQGPPGTPVLAHVGAPTCAIGDLKDLYVDISSGCLYYKLTRPVPPNVRAIPVPTGTTLLVGSTRPYTTIQDAIDAASDGDRLLLDAETFNITTTIDVNKSVTIEGQGMTVTTVITTSLSTPPYYMFNVTVSDVAFKNMKIVQDYPRSTGETDTVIAINDITVTGIYIDNCEIGISEIGIGTKASEFQITNCNFVYAPNALLNNKYACILIQNTAGNSIIYNNTFVPGSQNVGCFFIRITNVEAIGGTLQNKLYVGDNTQIMSSFTLRHLLDIEEFIGSDFELYIYNNTTVNEGNVPVLLYGAVLSIFKFIEVVDNTVQNTAGKGLIGIDGWSTGTTDIFNSGNTIVNEFFRAGWASATIPTSFIVGYDTSITPAPVLPLAGCYWLSLCCCT